MSEANPRSDPAPRLRWADLRLPRAELRVVRKLRRRVKGATWVIEDCKTERAAGLSR